MDNTDHLLSKEADAEYVASVIAAWAQRYLDDVHAAPVASGEDRYRDTGACAVNFGGLTARLQSRGFSLLADEPKSMGGGALWPTPYDFLNLALASCTSMTLRMYADRKGWPLEGVETVVTHERVHADDCADCEHTEGRIDLLSRTVRIKGDLDEEQRARLLQIADRCPVHRTLKGQLEIRTTTED